MPPEVLADMARTHIVVLAHDNEELVGCGFGEIRDANRLYLSKLAVRGTHRRRGILRKMIELFADQARQRDLGSLTLATRIELTENHRAFRALDFVKTAEARHPGYDRTTSLTFTRAL